VWTGDITADELALYWTQYLKDPQVLSIRRTLVDLRESNILFRGEVFSHFVSTIVEPVLSGRDWKTAIVVSEAVQFGVSRQYQVFADSFSRDSIFYDDDSALEWLIQQKLNP